MKKLMMALVLGAIMVVGCRSNREQVRDGFEKMSYQVDSNTSLCFAFFWAGGLHGGPAFANVPCTPAVMKLATHGADSEKVLNEKASKEHGTPGWFDLEPGKCYNLKLLPSGLYSHSLVVEVPCSTGEQLTCKESSHQ